MLVTLKRKGITPVVGTECIVWGTFDKCIKIVGIITNIKITKDDEDNDETVYIIQVKEGYEDWFNEVIRVPTYAYTSPLVKGPMKGAENYQFSGLLLK